MTVTVNNDTKTVTVGIQGIQGAGATTFLGLQDTPTNFVAGKILKVDNNANSLILVDNDTNLSYVPSTRVLSTDTGTNVTLPLVDTTNAGLLSAADKSKLDGIEPNSKDDQTGAEIKLLYEAEADTNAFDDAFKNKLLGIEANATEDQTAEEIRTLVQAANNSNVFEDADHNKLDGIEAAATQDQTSSEIKALYESEADTNAYTDAEKAKLLGIEANATQDQTDAEIRALVDSATDSNVLTDALKNKIDGIEQNATQDQTDAEIRAAVEAATDSNVFTDADHNKLNLIEDQATQDQTGAEIKQLYEAESNTNAYTDAEKSKLAAIEAQADVTDTANVDAAGAVMNTDTSTTPMGFVVDEDNMVSNSDTKVPTQQSVKAYVDSEVADLVNSAPASLDTLKELSDALGQDANFSTTVNNNIATKLPLAGGTMTGDIVMGGTQTVDGRDLSVDGAKLDTVESNAKDDQTGSEIKALYEAESNTNAYTDAEKNKLANVENNAKDDQTAAEIKTLLNSNGIVNAQIDANAAIQGTKISPDFGGQIIKTTGYIESDNIKITSGLPQIHLEDSNNNSDFKVQNNNGTFTIKDDTNSADRLKIDSSGTLDVTGNLQTTNINPASDSTYDLGSSAVRYANIYADNLHGDASNLTNLPPTIGGSNGVDFNDNTAARFGNSNDLELIHDGTDSKISSTQGKLAITHTGNGMIEFRRQGGVGFSVDGGGRLLPSSANIDFGYSTASYRWKNIYGQNGDFSGTLTTSAITPVGSLQYDIGSSNYKYASIWTDVINNNRIKGYNSQNIYFNNSHNSQDIRIASGSGGAVYIDGNLRPYTTNAEDLGTSSYKWKDVYATNFHGDGSNLTNLPAPSPNSNLTLNDDKFFYFGNSTDSSLKWDNSNTRLQIRSRNGGLEFAVEVGSADQGFYLNYQGNIEPRNDNTTKLGLTNKKWSEVHATTYYGSGANLTNLPAPDWTNVTNNLLPNVDSARELGSSSKAWQRLYTDEVRIGGNGRLQYEGAYIGMVSANGHMQLKQSESKEIQLLSKFSTGVLIAEDSGDLMPTSDSSIDIGSNTVRFQNIYADTLYGDGSNLTGISSDLVNDTTPELGGNLYTNGNFIELGDSSGANDDRLKFGNHDDLHIYHDGTTSIIKDTKGDFDIIGDSIDLKDTSGNKKLETTSTTVDVHTGILGIKNTGTQSEMRLYCESNNAHYAAIKAPAHSTFSGNLTYTLPSSYGNNAQVLTSDGQGGMSWTTPSAGASVAGSNTQIQYNASGALAGSSNLTFDGTNLTVGGTISATSSSSSVAGHRKITTSTSTPSGGSDGDLWIQHN